MSSGKHLDAAYETTTAAKDQKVRQPEDLEQDVVSVLHPANRPRAERKLLRKIDLRMSILVVIYILNYMDRNNMSAARLKGFEEDLGLNDNEYQTCLSILYVGYIYAFLNKIGKPSLYLPFAMSVWGMLSCVTGETVNYTGAVLCRFFLGFVEAAFFPGALFLLSKWYTRKELATRYTILYLGNLISNAFNGLIASGILSNMEGTLGHRAWRWLFYIEGAATVFVALCAVFILPDFPTTTRWLTDEEKLLAQARAAEDAGEADEDIGERTFWQTLGDVLTDYKVWLLTLILTAQVVGLSFNQFFPTLTSDLGYDSTISLLLTAPPWAFACIVAFVNAYYSDRNGSKCWHIIGPILFGIVGCVLGISTTEFAPRYIGLFLMAQAYAGFIIVYSWISSTIARPTAKRAFAIGFINAFSQLGNIAGSYVWPSKWAPYHNSFGICIACFGVSIVASLVLRWDLIRLNRKMDQGIEAAEVHDGAVQRAAQLGGIEVATAAAARRGWRYLY